MGQNTGIDAQILAKSTSKVERRTSVAEYQVGSKVG
jgi:hypothetical protein